MDYISSDYIIFFILIIYLLSKFINIIKIIILKIKINCIITFDQPVRN